MKVFVWSSIDKCTDNYHSGGGVVVFAEDEAAAREAAAVRGCRISHHEAPDSVREVVGGEPQVYVMPNAGCC